MKIMISFSLGTIASSIAKYCGRVFKLFYDTLMTSGRPHVG